MAMRRRGRWVALLGRLENVVLDVIIGLVVAVVAGRLRKRFR
jgi:hypothetical protein